MIRLVLAFILTMIPAHAAFVSKLSNGGYLTRNTLGNVYDRNGLSLSVSQGKVLFSFNTNGSFAFSNRKLQLSGDVVAPGNSKYYGTNGSGTKGWYTAGVGTVSSVSNADTMLTVTSKTTTPFISITGNTLTSAKILNGTVATADIAANAITSGLISNGTITTKDLAVGVLNGTILNASTKVISSGVVNGTTANFTKLIASGSVNGAVFTGTRLSSSGPVIAATNINGTTANFTKIISTGRVNGTNLIASNGMSMLSLVNYGNGGSAKTLDPKKGNFIYLQLNGSTCAIKIAKPNGPTRAVIALRQFSATRLATWNADIAWPTATAPTLSTTSGYTDFVTCVHMGSTILSNKWNCQFTGDLR
jgi:hypothetical protein